MKKKNFLNRVFGSKQSKKKTTQSPTTSHEFTEHLKGKLVLAGITFIGTNGAVYERYQTSGIVVALEENGLLILKRNNETSFQVPLYPNSLRIAEPGEYHEKEGGSVVVNPDYIISLEVNISNTESITTIKAHGFSLTE